MFGVINIMAILESEILIELKKGLLGHFKELGYPVSSIKTNYGKVPKGTILLVKVEDLPKGNTIKLTKICDDCGKHVQNQEYSRILSYRNKNNGKDLCQSCGTKKGVHKRIEKVPNNESLEYYATENNKEYLLREYSNKNEKSPSDIYKSSGLSCLWNCSDCGSEYNSVVFSRTAQNTGCPYCDGKQVNHTNCLWTTHPEIAKLLTNMVDGYRITSGSGKKVSFTCPDCGNDCLNTPTHIKERGFSCSRCSDGISYPEKFMISLLSQKGLYFETQKTFEWSKNVFCQNEKLNGNKKYDFYIPSLNCIIETHGGNHYNGKFITLNGKSLSEEQENDKLKEQLAKDNGIEEYIVIDCLHSNMNYLKNSIISSRLSNYFNIKNIDWFTCDVFATKSIIKKVCDLWNDGLSRKEIEKIVHLSYTTVIEYLKKGNSFGWCTYNARFEMLKSNRRNVKKILQYSLNMEFIKEFNSIEEASKITNINQSGISNVCNGKQKTSGKFIWLFKDEFEETKTMISQ